MSSYSRSEVKELTAHNAFDLTEGTCSYNYFDLRIKRKNLVKNIFALSKKKDITKHDNRTVLRKFHAAQYSKKEYRNKLESRLEEYDILDSQIEKEFALDFNRQLTELIYLDFSIAFERAKTFVLPEGKISKEKIDRYINSEIVEFTAVPTSLKTYKRLFHYIGKHVIEFRDRPVRLKYQSIRRMNLKKICANITLERKRIEIIRQIAFESFKQELLKIQDQIDQLINEIDRLRITEINEETQEVKLWERNLTVVIL